MRGWLRLLAVMLALIASIAGRPAPRVAAAAEPPTRLTIASIGVDSPVEAVSFRERNGVLEWGTSDWAVGWNIGSAAPGQAGNLVLSGHNASRNNGVFKDLHRVVVGERVTVYAGDRAYDYIITERHILPELLTSAARRRANAAWAGPFPDERLTLITCHPTWSNTHRLVLVAKPVAPASAEPADRAPAALAAPAIPLVWPDIFSPASPLIAHP